MKWESCEYCQVQPRNSPMQKYLLNRCWIFPPKKLTVWWLICAHLPASAAPKTEVKFSRNGIKGQCQRFLLAFFFLLGFCTLSFEPSNAQETSMGSPSVKLYPHRPMVYGNGHPSFERPPPPKSPPKSSQTHFPPLPSKSTFLPTLSLSLIDLSPLQ